MQLENSFRVPVPVDEAWRVLLDVERVAPCMPGATLDSVDGDRSTGEMKVKLGPINLTYQGTATVTSKDEAAHRAVIVARGKDQRGNGTATALITATLAADGATTRVDLVTDLTITGRPAQFGKGVMTDVGNKLLGQFADKLAAQLAATPATTPIPKATETTPIAKAAATATGAVEEIAASVEQVPGDGAAAAAVKKAAAATKKAAAGATEKVTEPPTGKKAAAKKAAPAKKAVPAKKAAPAKKAVPAKAAAPAKKAAPPEPASPARDSVPAGAKRPSGPPSGPSAPPTRPATGAPVRSVPAAGPTAPRPAQPEPIDLLEVSGGGAGRYAPALGAAAAVFAVVLLVRRRRRRRTG